MYGAYNAKGGVQLTPDSADPYDTSGSPGFPASKYHYAFEVFGNNGTTPEGGVATAASNHSLDDLTNTAPNLIGTIPNEATVKTDLQETLGGSSFVGSDHYPIFGDYAIVVAQPPVASFSAKPTNGVAPLTVAFTDASTGTITNWFWNFGDGVTNAYTTTTATHIYTNAGVYTVTETVTGPGGSNVLAISNLITVLTPFQGWQLLYFGSTNAAQAQPTVDADGTGQNNLFKYEAGLNPTNPASVFVFNVTSVPGPPAGASLVFSPLVAGRAYTPLFSTNLLNGPWAPLTTGSGPVTNGSQVRITDTNTTLPQGFYQIQISNP
jgi:PKD repeat protein